MNHSVPAHRLPDGFGIRLRADLLRAENGRVLVGGAPARVLKLSEAALRALASGSLTVSGPGAAALARRLLQANMADPVLPPAPSPTPSLVDDLTVVIPVRDRPDQLDRCLQALIGARVIVVDDASHDPAAVAAVVERHRARHLTLSINQGPAGARNAGLALVETPCVAFVDSDLRVSPETLTALARHLLDPSVALVAPRVMGRATASSPWFERHDAAFSSLDVGPVGGLVRPGATVGWVPSACLVGRTEVLRALDGFDADWRVGEDVDLVWRLLAAGHEVRYDPSLRTEHEVRGTARGWLGRTFFYGTSGAALAERHGANVAPAVMSVPMAVGAAAVLHRRWWSVPVAGAALLVTAVPMRRALPLEIDATRVTGLLVARSLGWAVRQESGLLLRHWWPAATLLALAPTPLRRPVRRALASALAVDTWVLLRERRGVPLAVALPARRLSDLAYGAGLWTGAGRARSAAALAVRWVKRPR